jgi:hypothetical protein
MPLVVTARVLHREMDRDRVYAVLRKHIPGLLVSTPDFSADRSDCKVEFLCNTSTTLDFTVTLKSSTGPASAAVAILTRESQSLNSAVLKALGRPFQKAKLAYCYLEDGRSRSKLLYWVWEKPLSSRPAKLSYILSIALLIIGSVLVYLMFKQKPSDSRTDSIISLVVAICLGVLVLPIPFVNEHLRLRGNGRWVFSHDGDGSS